MDAKATRLFDKVARGRSSTRRPSPTRASARCVLDVYVGEFEHTPAARLWSDPRVLIAPHISAASDQDRHGGIDVFCDNRLAYLDRGSLRSVIDWERGLLSARWHSSCPSPRLYGVAMLHMDALREPGESLAIRGERRAEADRGRA
jgi:hypothetical protein